jgi:NAD(P)-dependent dehydrogenase (short-subunit alcohol dehydrogenase family)
MSGMAERSCKYGAKLRSQRLLVIGGSSGIGFAVADAARQFGATVIVSGSKEDKLVRALERIRKVSPESTNDELQGFVQDLSDLATLQSRLKHLLDSATEGGRHKLDHIVYTAGNVVGFVDLATLDTDTITSNGILRFYVPIMIGQLASRYVKPSHTSSITFTSGYSNMKPRPGRVLMAGWAAGVEGVSRALAVDLRPIRVNCVCTGAVYTELFSRMPKAQLDPLVDKYVRETMTSTIGRPEEVAEAFLYCMRDSFVDGAVIHTDGGFLLS